MSAPSPWRWRRPAAPTGESQCATVDGWPIPCVLEHIPAVESVLSEVARVLKPGGLFAFSVPAPRLLAVAAETHPADPSGFVEAFNERVEHRNVWSAERWAAALAAAGLLVHDIRGFMPPDAAAAWFEAYDWVVRPIRGRGALYRLAGPGLRRFGLGRALASYWRRRLTPWAGRGVSASLEEACALFVTAKRPG
ncbi:MAG: class I SAM-dependent methyltransferase [Armatimonadetes bacterium]|nr:class I SAM-dependent methyltransferase [Armatimonadota bacterium]